MKTIITKLLMLAAVLPASTNIYAYDFEVDGIYYNIISSTEKAVEVTNRYFSGNDYSGNVVIPKQVSYNNDTYSVTSIGNYAFSYCTGLTSVTIPNSVTFIDNFAFRGCYSLKGLVIEDGEEILELGNNNYSSSDTNGLFNDCPLESVYLGRNLGYISYDSYFFRYGYSPFCGTPITTLTISDSVTSIGDYAFGGCSRLTSLTIPNSVTSIGEGAFRYCRGLASVTIGNSVTSIGDYAFEECSRLTSITIPNSVTTIGESAFYYCTGLEAVNISDLSAWCKIEFIDLFSNPLYYAHSLYLNGKLLTDLTIPDNITEIKDYAFYGCTGLTSVTIPNSVTSIGNYAFYGCTGLTSVTMGNRVTSIGDSAFYNCTGLTSVTIGNSVTSIGSSAFYKCNGLTSVTMGNSVTSIGNSAFYNCIGLKTVNISDLSAWCKIGFYNNYSNPLNYAHNLYLNGKLLTDLTIPDDITEIKDCAFYGCRGLTSVTIPNNVTAIGNYAFSGCSALESFSFGHNVTTIGEEAFSDCTAMNYIQSRAEVPPVCGYQALEDINKRTCKLFVLEGSLEAYKAAYPWKEFFFFGGVEDAVPENGGVSVATYRDSIEIIGADNAVITVYNTNGQIVYSDTETVINVPSKGIYIVRVSDQIYKIAVL